MEDEAAVSYINSLATDPHTDRTEYLNAVQDVLTAQPTSCKLLKDPKLT